MSRLIVRRLTAAIMLVTVLCFAVPAMAAAPARSHARTPAVLGTGLFDQILSWVSSFLPGAEPTAQGPAAKTLLGTDITDPSRSVSEDPDRGAMIDPNGGR